MSKELQAKLDSAAKALQPIFDKAMSEIDQQSWSCRTCGATTIDPEHMLIVYFHMNCPGK
jgi:rubrerythrin